MKKQLSPETLKAFVRIGELLGGGAIHINQPYICDHCQDEEKEAFPYGVSDRAGKHWDDLCHDCFEELGCEYPDEEFEEYDNAGFEQCPDCGAYVSTDGACWFCDVNPGIG